MLLVERRDKFQCARALSLSEATGRILGAAVDVQLHFYELERRRNLRSVADGSSSKGLTSGQMREKESRRRFLPSSVAQSVPSCSEERPEDTLLKDPVAVSSFDDEITEAMSQEEDVIADVIRLGEGGGAVGDARFTAGRDWLYVARDDGRCDAKTVTLTI